MSMQYILLGIMRKMTVCLGILIKFIIIEVRKLEIILEDLVKQIEITFVQVRMNLKSMVLLKKISIFGFLLVLMFGKIMAITMMLVLQKLEHCLIYYLYVAEAV